MDRKHRRSRPPGWGALAAGLAWACSGRGPADPGISPPVGTLVEKPGGGFFLADAHRGGGATRLRLVEMGWGRLVDVYDVGADGEPGLDPVLRDVAIGEDVITDGNELVLDIHPVTNQARLVILRPREAPDEGAGTFLSILARASSRLGAIEARHDDGSSSPPFSYAARNGVLVLRFDDLLEDGPEAGAALSETVRLTVGYPPVRPLDARIVFDPSHGGIQAGAFHSTRVLVDFTVSEREALAAPVRLSVNVAGLPPGSPESPQANASIHLPTRLDPATGRFVRLTNLDGRGLAPEGPLELATQDLVRAFRGGSPEDTNRGFLLDFVAPSLLAAWDVIVEEAAHDPAGPPGRAFEVQLAFRTVCGDAPRRGDTLMLGGEPYEVRESGLPPDGAGVVPGVRLLRLDEDPLDTPGALLGLGRFMTPYRASAALHPACWVTLTPLPEQPPFDGVSRDANVHLFFSEPMDPDSFRAFDNFRILRGSGGGSSDIRASDLVVGSVRVAQNLQEFVFEPRLPFSEQGEPGFRFELIDGAEGARDLAGGALGESFGRATFALSSLEPPAQNGGLALRFMSRDEVDPRGLVDMRGQVFFEPSRGVLLPRRTMFGAYTADPGNEVPALMPRFGPGVQTPLSAFGSRLQALWRHCDFGFRVRDENFYNLDVVGLSWSPVGGTLLADFFPLFELRLAHGRYLPDEAHAPFCVPDHPDSGMDGFPFQFDRNVLADPRGQPAIVHPRSLGYRIRPSDMVRNEFGTPLLPFPWNRSGAPLTTFTWRDTSVAARGGLRGTGVPLNIEINAGFDVGQGEVAGPGQVRSVGLPLLWEVRCFPSSSSIGLNALEILLPVQGWQNPNFRAFSTGGIDQTGRIVTVDPDAEVIPRGGFNPSSNPPGQRTRFSADNSFYVGAIDTVVRVSRAVTAWIDTGHFAPRLVEPVLEPRQQPGTSAVLVEYRGADSFSVDAGSAPFDATRLDLYGDFETGNVTYHGDGSWSDDVDTVHGARFLQVRFSFLNDIVSSLSPALDSCGLAWNE